MCKWGTNTLVRVKIPADLSCTGQEKWKEVGIDSCIAPLVKALQDGGIDMRGSCCGHGKIHGHIHLEDGRILLILPEWCNECRLYSCISGTCYRCGRENGRFVPRKKCGPRLPERGERKP